MIRERIAPGTIPGESHFRWRGGDVSRLENLADVVFGFALTLIVMSIGVPERFSQILDGFRMFPGFLASFLFLFWCWISHFIFHRRYGLEDVVTNALNALLLLVILAYVYPMRFLAFFLAGSIFGVPADSLPLDQRIESGQQHTLMLIYTLGIVVIFLLYAFMNLYAYSKREALRLDAAEIQAARGSIRGHLLTVSVGLLVLSVILVSAEDTGRSGLLFFLIPVCQATNGFYTGNRVRRALAQS